MPGGMGSSTQAGRCMYDFLCLSSPPAKTHLIPRAWLALLFVACCWTQKGDYCKQIITDKHLNELQDLVSLVPASMAWGAGAGWS